jgi:aryl-alcohol dehydrogenase-like predicted oxidoreductase
MKYIQLDETELAQIALGCDHYGETISESIAIEQLDIYLDAGGNLLDTAHVYGQNEVGGPSSSEQLLGRYLKTNRNRKDVVLASKGCHPPKDDMHASRVNHRAMVEDVSQTLDNLKTDYLDIWFFHRDDPAMPSDEIIDMAQYLVDKKLVKHLGASNWTHRRIAEANAWAKEKKKTQFSISQIQWSLAHCTPKQWGDDTLVCMTEEARRWYEEQKMPVMAFSPQAKGFFSKMIAGVGETLSERAKRRFATDVNLSRVPHVCTLAEELGVSPAAVVIAYITSQKNPSIAIAGSSKVEQIIDTLNGADLTLTEEQLAFLAGK